MEQIVYIGDIHGNFDYLKSNIDRTKFGNNQEIAYLIQVGDFGIGFNKKEKDIETLLLLNKFLKLRNIKMYVIRGNHDDPAYFNNNHIYSNLQLLKDYTELFIYNKKYLFIGGALSIDRKVRITEDNYYRIKYPNSNNISYWENENFLLDEERINNIKDIDILITHTAQSFCYPIMQTNHIYLPKIVKDYLKDDNKLLNDLIQERKDMDKLFELLKNNNNISEHYYGHFHYRNIMINNNCKHILLDIDQFY